MLYRNFLAMETEELLRSHPIDGAVLMGGCDKTTPGLLMGAISAGLPCIYLPAGPMLRGNWQRPGARLGLATPGSTGTSAAPASIDAGRWTERRGRHRAQPRHLHDHGHGDHDDGDRRGASASRCPARSSIPAADAGHVRMSAECGRRIVEMVWDDLTPARILSRASFDNAIAVAMAMGCSTNAIIHLVAMARRAGFGDASTTSTR